MSAANYLTISRLFVSPIFFWIYLQLDHLGWVASLLLLCLLGFSELSDFLDGYVARKYNQVTDLGKILDPMADRLARLGIFLIFTLPPLHLPMMIVFMFLYRDFIISSLRTVCALKGFVLAARMSGKVKAIIQGFSLFITVWSLLLFQLGFLSFLWVENITMFSCGFAALFSIASGCEYIFMNRKYIQSALIATAK